MSLVDKAKYRLKTKAIGWLSRNFARPFLDPKSTPIIINSFNRLTTLRLLIGALESRGYGNIFIIDNKSTYRPLLDFYGQCRHPVFRLKKNVGHNAIWKTGIYRRFWKGYYVYTDPDVVPAEECPEDFLQHFHDLMLRYPDATKVGFGLKIDDIPDCFNQKANIVFSESRYWQHQLEKDVYRAPIDTTFALYRPFSKTNVNWHMLHIRTGGRYLARHLPWYSDSANLSEEEAYYLNACRRSISTFARMDDEKGDRR